MSLRAAAVSRQNAAVTNGRALAAGIDGRSAEARRLRDIVEALSSELGGGALAPSDLLQIKTAASLAYRVEQLMADQANGRDVDSEELTRVAHASARCLAALRRGRKPAPPPTMRERLEAERLAEASS